MATKKRTRSSSTTSRRRKKKVVKKRSRRNTLMSLAKPTLVGKVLSLEKRLDRARDEVLELDEKLDRVSWRDDYSIG